MKLKKEIQAYIPVIEGVAALFQPFVEAAVHDLTTGKIVLIYNNISKRNAGDPSPLQELGMPIEKFPDVFDPYYKINWDGRKLKCTSITVRDENKKPIALICFNFDTSVFRDMQLNLSTLLDVKKNAENPIELFKDNWQEKIDTFIKQSMNGNYAQIKRLPVEEKKKIVQNLYQHGLFNYKGAAVYIAEQLDVSRASVYNYLKA
jgi:predicted transcriptional regulator YheO